MDQTPELKFETEETLVLREGSNVVVDHCSGCRKDVLMAVPRTAAFLASVGERHIFRLIEAGVLHFTENGRVLVCLDSLRSSVGNSNYPDFGGKHVLQSNTD